MKIYTRDKKPKLYVLIPVTALFAVLLAVAVAVSGDRGGFALANSAVILTAYLLTVIVILAVALIRQLEYNPYSYNTVYYFAFALFLSYLMISVGITAIRSFSGAEGFTLSDAAKFLLNSARSFIYFTLPFLFALSAALVISNIILIKREGVRLANVLGIILAFLIVGSVASLVFLNENYIGRYALAVDVFCAVFLYFECMLIGTIFADLFAAFHVPEHDKDFIIILGCRVRKDGTPTPLLRGRIDKAYRLGSDQIASCGKEPVFIASGGKGSDEPISEAECIKNTLKEYGVSEDKIILEDRSTDTLENLRFSIEKTGGEGKFAFSTTNYHVFRSGIAANRAKKHVAEGIGSKTKWYFWPNAAVREFAGLLTEHRGKQAAVLAGLAVFYALLSVAA